MNTINISFSTDTDRPRVLELAELDGKAAPQGEALLAEVDGRLVARVQLSSGSRPAPSTRWNTSELCTRPTSLRSMRPQTSSRI
jgi:hypothetical protein